MSEEINDTRIVALCVRIIEVRGLRQGVNPLAFARKVTEIPPRNLKSTAWHRGDGRTNCWHLLLRASAYGEARKLLRIILC